MFSLFTKELLSELEYRFKIDITANQKVADVLDKMITYLKGQRSMVLARYNLFTRRQQRGETFEDWYCEIRRLYDLAEADEMSGDDIVTVTRKIVLKRWDKILTKCPNLEETRRTILRRQNKILTKCPKLEVP